MCPRDNNSLALANRKETYDRPEKWRNSSTYIDNASDQISNQFNIYKPRNL